MLWLLSRPVVHEGSKTLYLSFWNQIYFAQQGNIVGDYRALSGVDASTFEPINQIWAKDENAVYFRAEKTSFSPETFSHLGCYVSDGSLVYYVGGPGIRNLVTVSTDAERFELIGEDHALNPDRLCKAKDTETVYFWATPVEHANPATFRFLNHTWAADANRVFMDGKLTTGLSPNELQGLGTRLVTDGVTVIAPSDDPPYYTDLGISPQDYRYEVESE